jgi:hypothetical protein
MQCIAQDGRHDSASPCVPVRGYLGMRPARCGGAILPVRGNPAHCSGACAVGRGCMKRSGLAGSSCKAQDRSACSAASIQRRAVSSKIARSLMSRVSAAYGGPSLIVYCLERTLYAARSASERRRREMAVRQCRSRLGRGVPRTAIAPTTSSHNGTTPSPGSPPEPVPATAAITGLGWASATP